MEQRLIRLEIQTLIIERQVEQLDEVIRDLGQALVRLEKGMSAIEKRLGLLGTDRHQHLDAGDLSPGDFDDGTTDLDTADPDALD